ncbi:uncharacterized protein LOC112044565 [Bicyclus anynana]|uniref:Uncharacterized protein LOC112044565 n=1 Tax=Bicyclus anynana TaxID=110368 RepID=A0A6J1MTG6_BICAN|nr:uncharacterized protein LOC112044565 [Bicyclus anynana]
MFAPLVLLLILGSMNAKELRNELMSSEFSRMQTLYIHLQTELEHFKTDLQALQRRVSDFQDQVSHLYSLCVPRATKGCREQGGDCLAGSNSCVMQTSAKDCGEGETCCILIR